jgi:septum formation protein
MILRWAGIPFRTIEPIGVTEDRLPGENPERMVQRLASLKAGSVSALARGLVVLAADTVVVSRGRVLGKPRDREEARRTLLDLQGRGHRVLTGVALFREGRAIEAFVERTLVRFGRVPPRVLEGYLSTPIPYDKAGGYDIQGAAGEWITGIDGDYFNVMGLPLQRTLESLRKAGKRTGERPWPAERGLARDRQPSVKIFTPSFSRSDLI